MLNWGINLTVPDFESYIRTFISSNLYPIDGSITYPEKNYDEDNFLSDHITEVEGSVMMVYGVQYSMIAEVPRKRSYHTYKNETFVY